MAGLPPLPARTRALERKLEEPLLRSSFAAPTRNARRATSVAPTSSGSTLALKRPLSSIATQACASSATEEFCACSTAASASSSTAGDAELETAAETNGPRADARGASRSLATECRASSSARWRPGSLTGDSTRLPR